MLCPHALFIARALVVQHRCGSAATHVQVCGSSSTNPRLRANSGSQACRCLPIRVCVYLALCVPEPDVSRCTEDTCAPASTLAACSALHWGGGKPSCTCDGVLVQVRMRVGAIEQSIAEAVPRYSDKDTGHLSHAARPGCGHAVVGAARHQVQLWAVTCGASERPAFDSQALERPPPLLWWFGASLDLLLVCCLCVAWCRLVRARHCDQVVAVVVTSACRCVHAHRQLSARPQCRVWTALSTGICGPIV